MRFYLIFFSALLFFSACGSGDDESATDDAGTSQTTDSGNEEADGGKNDAGEEDTGPFLDPDTVMPSSELPDVRDYVIKRGIIHSHSPYSHDACDGEPFIDGVRNEQCFNECRAGMCDTYQDFVFLTDHSSLFADYEYPDVLLYKEGDNLIEHDGTPTANSVKCDNGHSVIVSAGTESGMMPIGIEHHIGATPEERKAVYGGKDGATAQKLKEAGALIYVYHTEEWTVEDIINLPLDGIEIYNLHANTMNRMGDVLSLVLKLKKYPDRLPATELALIGFFEESEDDLMRWSKALMIKQLPGVLATDAHRNVFNSTEEGQERLDSFRRMMHWFSNYVMLPKGDVVDDRTLKAAIDAGRLYCGFDYLGYPVGFDFHAESDGKIFEMGDKVSLDKEVELSVKIPSIYRLNPKGDQPELTARILKAVDGDWEVVASDSKDLSIKVDSAGAYRTEIRMIPYHLKPWLGKEADTYLKDTIWVYSNPIYIGGNY